MIVYKILKKPIKIIINNHPSFFTVAVCDFRLDFESFDIAPPSITTEADASHACKDIFLASVNTGSPSSVNTVSSTQEFDALPEICGENQGQHGRLATTLRK